MYIYIRKICTVHAKVALRSRNHLHVLLGPEEMLGVLLSAIEFAAERTELWQRLAALVTEGGAAAAPGSDVGSSAAAASPGSEGTSVPRCAWAVESPAWTARAAMWRQMYFGPLRGFAAEEPQLVTAKTTVAHALGIWEN
jgi:hypothetical protein